MKVPLEILEEQESIMDESMTAREIMKDNIMLLSGLAGDDNKEVDPESKSKTFKSPVKLKLEIKDYDMGPSDNEASPARDDLLSPHSKHRHIDATKTRKSNIYQGLQMLSQDNTAAKFMGTLKHNSKIETPLLIPK